MASQVIRVAPLQSVAFGSITSSYKDLGVAFGHSVRIIRFVNNTNGLLLISFDGSTDNLVLPAGSFVLYDVTTNKANNTPWLVFSNGTQAFVKYSGSAPTSGSVYLELLYGQGE